MKIREFVENYKAKRFMVAKQGVDERSEYLRKELEIKSYIPFREKRKIAEMIVAQNIKEVNGIKKYDSIDGYIGLIVASIAAHTNMEFGNDYVADYDMLAESGLLPHILAEFKGSHDEIEIILKMALAMEMEDNNTNALIGRFLNNISGVLDSIVDALRGKVEDLDFKDVLGADFEQEDIARLMGFLDKYIK